MSAFPVDVITGSHRYPIDKPLKSGGQADIYILRGQQKVAKLYRHLTVEASKSQQHRLETMIRLGSPAPYFVWPLEVIHTPSLGYVMDRVDGFVELEKLGETEFIQRIDLRTRLWICFRFADALEKLHNKTGFAFCDLSGFNVLCSGRTAEIRVIDTDNLWVEGTVAPAPVRGTYRCMAPELEARKIDHPTVESDLHSLAVLLFRTLLFHHPLLGDAVHEDASLEETALGAGALYIYDPRDHRNRYTAYNRFGGVPVSILPKNLSRLFEECFCKGLHAPSLRVRETRWKRELTNTIDLLLPCPNANCVGKQTFLNDPTRSLAVCVWCKSVIQGHQLLKITGPQGEGTQRFKTLIHGEVLYAHHCKQDGQFDFAAERACARIVHFAGGEIALENISKEQFSYYRPGESSPREFAPGKHLSLRNGCQVVFGKGGLRAGVVS